MADYYRVHANTRLCRDCQACVLGCSLYHDKNCNIGLARLTVKKDMARFDFAINICRHCKNPKCMSDCPPNAMYIDDRGVVIIVDEKCTRCGACKTNCPFNSIFYNNDEDRYLKCDLCTGRDEGPLCVELCSPAALTLLKSKTVKAEE